MQQGTEQHIRSWPSTFLPMCEYTRDDDETRLAGKHEGGVEDEILHSQTAEISGRICQSDTKHLQQELI